MAYILPTGEPPRESWRLTQYSKDSAWKAQQRLCSRYRSLTAKGKKSQVAITAVARELTGFMWDIALAAQSSFSQQKQN